LGYLVLPCVELIKVPTLECPCAVEPGCEVLELNTLYQRTLTDLNKHIIEYVMSVENSMRIEEVSQNRTSF
jgi:hypothetical protein